MKTFRFHGWTGPLSALALIAALLAILTAGLALGGCEQIWPFKEEEKEPEAPAAEEEPATYGINVSVADVAYIQAEEGYGTATGVEVSVANSGTEPTGELSVSLSNYDVFTVSPAGLPSIEPEGIVSFTVLPKSWLPAAVYNTTVTVNGAHGITRGFTVNFTVTGKPSENSIRLDGISSPYSFADAIQGYTYVPTATISVVNTGAWPTGAMTVSLGNNNAFTVTPASLDSIDAGKSAAFLIAPKADLLSGNYLSTVTVSSKGGASAEVYVYFTVRDEGISLTIDDKADNPYAFPSAPHGYTSPHTAIVTIVNQRATPTGDITIALSGANSADFVPSTRLMQTIPAGGDGIFSVTPVTGLAEGTYTATVTVSGASGVAALLHLSFTVAPNYSIRLANVSNPHNFPSEVEGYTQKPAPLQVSVFNTGGLATGDITIALNSSTDAFTLTPGTWLPSIAPYGEGSFTVGPRVGLGNGTYGATIRVSLVNGPSESFAVSFVVAAKDTALFGIELNVPGSNPYKFADAATGYDGSASDMPEFGWPAAVNVGIMNTGTRSTGELTVSFMSGSSEAFEIKTFSGNDSRVGSIPQGSWANISVRPKKDLTAGTYQATVSIGSIGNAQVASRAFAVSFTVRQTYNVTFNANGGTPAPAERKVLAGGTISEPLPMTRAGWLFKGWLTEANGGGSLFFNNGVSGAVNGDRTIHAYWRQPTVSFDSRGGSNCTPMTVDAGSKLDKLPTPDMANHIFLGWFYDTACQQPVDYNSTVNGDLKLFAGWHQTFRVTFEADGGTFPGGAETRKQAVRTGWTVSPPADNPSKSNDTFLYWYDLASDPVAEGLYPQYDWNKPVTGNLTLWALWLSASVLPPVYQIRYYVNGNLYWSDNAPFGNPSIPRPADPNVDGYVFTGWHWTGDTANASSKFDFTDKTVPAGGMDFTAILLSSSDNDLVDLHYRTRGGNLTNAVEFIPDPEDNIGYLLRIKQTGYYNIRAPQPTDTRIQIDGGLTVSITLTDAVIKPTSGTGVSGSAIDIGANSTVTLTIAGTNELSGKSLHTGNEGYANDRPSINAEGATLNITGDGTLKADSFKAQPGIKGGTINISGGTVNVERVGRNIQHDGDDGAASIYGTPVRISGGSVTAPTIGGSLNISSPGSFTGTGPDGKVYQNSHTPNP